MCIRDSSICLAENQQHALLAVVCDGIGGGKAGDVASALAAEHMKKSFEQAVLCLSLIHI